MTREVAQPVISNKPTPLLRDDFRAWITVPTRWADNDVYGHVNNAAYFGYFDTAVNTWLMQADLLAIGSSSDSSLEAQPIGLVVANACQYFAPLHFPQVLNIGLRVAHLGNSSVQYALGVFVQNGSDTAHAHGQFTHVYVNRHSRKPMPLPIAWRASLQVISI